MKSLEQFKSVELAGSESINGGKASWKDDSDMNSWKNDCGDTTSFKGDSADCE